MEHVAKLARQFHAPKIGCLGLTYKADVDDLRESPSLEIVRDLRKLNLGEVLACDPYVSSKRFTEFPLHALSDVVQQSQVLVLLTDHRQFRDIPQENIAGKSGRRHAWPVALAAGRPRPHQSAL